MKAPATKKFSLDLARLVGDRTALDTAQGRQLLRDALGSNDARLAQDAARVITEQLPSGFEATLWDAYRAFSGERASTLDPGCLGKEALLVALDALEDDAAELFAEAALYVQLERAKGGARDTGARVRTRGVLGLARLGHADLLPILATCLADDDATLRLSAARALAHRGQRDGASLLLLRAQVGDDSPEVVIECLRGLFATAPEFGVRQARSLLRSESTRQREQVLHALGTATHDAAIELLCEELRQVSLADERKAVIEALGLSLRPSARTQLLELVASDRSSDAEAALSALAIHRYDDKLVAQLRELSASSRSLSRLFSELFA
jgi:HEAT repeat protein